ncbi:MAG: DNA primase DnaG [Candidatus Diapherotrites archaeon]
MAKTYLNTTKYLVKLKFEIQGIVDKEDIIGAVFGQSEGLLGEEMDLKELQKSGKIARIEVFPKTDKGSTSGELHLPSSLDAAQTSLLAAAIESVEKVGPCEAKFEITSMEDVRSQKRDQIKDRAKSLLNKFLSNTESDATIMAEELRESARTLNIISYGREKLPAGPEIDINKELIIVEGRADVLNLIKASYSNVIGMQGSQIPKTIIDLTKTKTVTLFIDGDRGGELNARKLISLAKIEFIAKAPDGKEVEELTRKEINQALGKKMTLQEYLEKKPRTPIARTRTLTARTPRTTTREFEKRIPSRGGEYRKITPSIGFERRNPPRGIERMQFIPRAVPPTPEETAKFKPIMNSLNGTLKAKIFSKEMKELGEMQVRELIEKINKTQGIDSIVFDGIITKRLADKADALGISYLIAAKKGKLENNKVKTIVM